jgi:hypothetical protein
MAYYLLDKKMINEGLALCADWMAKMPFDVSTASFVIQSLFRAKSANERGVVQKLSRRILDHLSRADTVPVEEHEAVFRAATYSAATADDVLDNWTPWISRRCSPMALNCSEALEAFVALGDGVKAARFAYAVLDAPRMPLEQSFIWQLRNLVLPSARQQLGLAPKAEKPAPLSATWRVRLTSEDRKEAQSDIAEVVPYNLLSVPLVDATKWRPGASYVHRRWQLK